LQLEPEFTEEERSDLKRSIDILVAWFNTHHHGNPYFDAIQQSGMRKRLRERWRAEAALAVT
jgi:hypothetical protein